MKKKIIHTMIQIAPYIGILLIIIIVKLIFDFAEDLEELSRILDTPLPEDEINK